MVYMYHSFLVHSSADGHLGCFHVLAMTNSAVGFFVAEHRLESTWVSVVVVHGVSCLAAYGIVPE